MWLASPERTGGVFSDPRTRALDEDQLQAFREPGGLRQPPPSTRAPEPLSRFRDRLAGGGAGPRHKVIITRPSTISRTDVSVADTDRLCRGHRP